MLSQLLGRLHILILHFPIGILLLTALLEWLNYRKLAHIPRKVLTLNYGIGSASATLACITGYILSGSGDYGEGLVQNHMWTGIITAFISVLLLWYSYQENHNYCRWGAIVLAIAITVTGHLGGTITHGEGFFTDFSAADNSEQKAPVFNVENIAEALVYEDLVKPILEAKCVTCHGPGKKKGKLRLDSKEAMLAGGKSGNAVIGVGPEESEMVRRIHLPISEEKHMPPKNKIQLTKEELHLFKWWLENDNSFDKKIAEVSPGDSFIYPIIETIILDSEKGESGAHTSIIPADLPEVELAMPDQTIINALKELDIVVLKAGNASPFLEINFINVSRIEAKHWTILEQIAPHIVRLKLSGLEIKDENLLQVSKMDNLMRLYLDRTQISDKGLDYLKSLQLLHYLNLNHTSLSNKGILNLDSMKNLKIVYAYETAIDINELPGGAKIEIGGFQLPLLQTDTVRI
jgi:hypothetical protein